MTTRIRHFLTGLIMLFTLTLYQQYAYAWGMTISYGKGNPNNLHGGRIAVQKNFWKYCFQKAGTHIDGYWDFSLAHWITNGDRNRNDRNKNLTSVAIMPTFRLSPNKLILGYFTPFAEVGIGVVYHSTEHLAHRDLGSRWAFHDLLGVGVMLGCERRWSLSYHYLHYSNAGLFPPNNGVDIKVLLSLGYTFS